jgi:RNA polymerase sigma-70 factor (sigma-E family)
VDAVQDEVFRGFVAARGHALVRTAYLLTGDQHLAEDLVQTALERAVQHWSTIRDVGAAEQYVRRTMYRENISLWRRRRLTELPTQVLPEPRRERPDDDPVDRSADRMVLRDALMRLGPRQRTVLVLRYFEDLTEQQTADLLGISVGTVKSQSHKALHAMRSACRDLAPVTGGER